MPTPSRRLTSYRRAVLVAVVANVGVAVALPFVVEAVYAIHELHMMSTFRELEHVGALDPQLLGEYLADAGQTEAENVDAVDAAQLLLMRHKYDLRMLSLGVGLLLFVLSMSCVIMLIRMRRIAVDE